MENVIDYVQQLCWWKVSVQVVVSLVVIKVIDVLLITPIRLKNFYKAQGLNTDNWHPFHFISLVRKGFKQKEFLIGFKEWFLSDPDTKGYFFYYGFNPTIILNKTEQIKDLTQTKEAQFQRNPKRSESVELSVGRDNIIHGHYSQWKQSRKLFSAFFGFQNIKTMVPEVLSITKDNFKQFNKEDQVFNIIDVFGMITGQIIFSLFCGTNQSMLFDKEGNHLGLKLQDTVGKFNENARFGILQQFFGNSIKKSGIFKEDREILGDIRDIRQKLEEQMTSVIEKLIADPSSGNEFMRKVQPQLVELLQDKHRLVSEFMVIFNAGTDTTSHVIQQVLMNLHEFPEVKAKLMKEVDSVMTDKNEFIYEQVVQMKYLDQVIKESLRMNCPAPGINPREMKDKSKDIQLHDILVRKGTDVALFFMTTLLNKNYFSDPLKFMPERWEDGESNKLSDPFIFTPFSMGSRSCIGERMSLLEQKVILTYFLKNYDFKINTDISKINWVLRTVYQPKEPVQIQVSPRK